jgi:hypothetical protein
MYFIQKYADCWVVRDSITGGCKPLTAEETERLKNEFTCMKDEKVEMIAIDTIKSIGIIRESYNQLRSVMGSG